MDVVKDGLAVAGEVHAAEEHQFRLVGNEAVAPARSRYITKHRYSGPAVVFAIINVQVVQRHVFDNREDGIIAATKDDELVLEESG